MIKERVKVFQIITGKNITHMNILEKYFLNNRIKFIIIKIFQNIS